MLYSPYNTRAIETSTVHVIEAVVSVSGVNNPLRKIMRRVLEDDVLFVARGH